jgi:uncharacterized protein
MVVKAKALLPGPAATAKALVLSAPISFWGGVDPATGDIIDARHPERGKNIAGSILALPGTIGSSSASAVLLELVHAGKAPAAILMTEPDAILLLGLVVAREMGWTTPAAWQLSKDDQKQLRSRRITVATDGTITFVQGDA